MNKYEAVLSLWHVICCCFYKSLHKNSSIQNTNKSQWKQNEALHLNNKTPNIWSILKMEVGLKSIFMDLMCLYDDRETSVWFCLYVLLCFAGSPTKAWQVIFGGLSLFVVSCLLSWSRTPGCCSHLSNYTVIPGTCSALLNLCGILRF